jgi:hypothetical protein
VTDAAIDSDGLVATLDGQRVVLSFRPTLTEHQRRNSAGVGSVRSRRLLHALWAVPHGVAVGRADVDPVDLATMDAEGAGFVELDDRSLVRVYEPAGAVDAVTIVRRRLVDAVHKVGEFPPTLRRFAVATGRSATDLYAVETAVEIGVGTAIETPTDRRVLTDSAERERGVPGIYRWWLAEVAYGQWLQTNAHCTS